MFTCPGPGHTLLSPDLCEGAPPAGLLAAPHPPVPSLPPPVGPLVLVPRLPLVPDAEALDELPELRQTAAPLAVVRGRGGAAHCPVQTNAVIRLYGGDLGRAVTPDTGNKKMAS